MLLAIDPGTDTGWAFFEKRNLIACGLGDPRSCQFVNQVSMVVVEVPRIYPGGRTRNPQDVLKLAVKAGRWFGWFEAVGGPTVTVAEVAPHEWKGQTPKEIQHARAFAKLSEAEKAVVDGAGRGMAASKRHNMLDAVGIGLWHLGR